MKDRKMDGQIYRQTDRIIDGWRSGVYIYMERYADRQTEEQMD